MSSFSDKNIDSLKGLGKVRLDERFTKEELKEMCRERDLHVSGDKEDLINNLMKWKKKLKKGNHETQENVNRSASSKIARSLPDQSYPGSVS